MKEVFSFLSARPEIVEIFLTVALLLLVKFGYVSVREMNIAYATAKALLGKNKTDSTGSGDVKPFTTEEIASKVTDATMLRLPEAVKVVKDVKGEISGGDSNKKKVQRAARAILHGLIRL